ncbi:phosphatase PAP2 family protein [Alkanindiges sp. WGS2144]|uniref:phosphatase PAP2 family protein n=1 Tax=Alkanindiges sp. WGS2144 TaxID=3366808 RepID=UPI0037530E3D
MNQSKIPAKTRLLSVAIFMSLIFAVLGFTVQLPALTAQETSWLWELQHWQPSGLMQVSIALAYVGGTPGMAVIILLISSFAYKQQRRDISLFAMVAFAGSVMTGWIGKEIISRPRPEVWDKVAPYYGYSFPSNHSVYAVILAGILIMASLHTRWRNHAVVFGMIWSVLMGVSRMYLGAHFATDVLGGWVLAIAWLCLLSWVFIHFNLFQYRASTPAGNHEVKL